MMGGIKDRGLARFFAAVTGMPFSVGLAVYCGLKYMESAPPDYWALAGAIVFGLATVGCIYDAAAYIVQANKAASARKTPQEGPKPEAV